MTEQASSLFCHTHYDNPTIKQLYRYSYDCQNRIHVHDFKLIQAVNITCSTQTSTLEKAKKSLKDIPGASKDINIIDRGLEYNAHLKRKFSSVDSDASDESLEIPKKLLQENAADSPCSTSTYESERAFVHNSRRNLKERMDWERCLAEGHVQGLFKRFSTKGSLCNHFSK